MPFKWDLEMNEEPSLSHQSSNFDTAWHVTFENTIITPKGNDIPCSFQALTQMIVTSS